MTDFYSQNRCVCSTRSHGPLLCAFCLSFHFKMNGADSEPRRQLPTTAARENDCNATQVTSVMCRIWRPSRNTIFCDQSYFCMLSVSD